MKLDKLATRPVSIANPGDTLNMAIQSMWQRECEHLPVATNGKLVGMLSERDVLIHAYGDSYAAHELVHVDLKQVFGSTRVDDVMSSPVRSLSPEQSVEDAVRLMLQEGFHALPLVKLDSIIGIVTETDLLKCFLAEDPIAVGEQLVNARVADHMTSHVFSVRDTDLRPTVVRLMRDKSIRHIPVVDDDQNLVGILSERDVLYGRKFEKGIGYILRRSTEESTSSGVAELMTTEPIAIGLEHKLRDAAKTMINQKISCIPVVEDRSLVGIITSTDLLRALLHALV